MNRGLIVLLLMAGLGVAACGDNGEVVDIPFSEVRQAMDGEPAAFEAYFRSIQGKTVRWSGRVTESFSTMEQMREKGFLLVDMDTAGQGSDAADVILETPVSKVDDITAGDSVSFVGTIQRLDRVSGGFRLRLYMNELQE